MKDLEGPWSARSRGLGEARVYVWGPDGDAVALVYSDLGCDEPETAEQRAQAIVTAVNCHDELVAALESVLAAVPERDDWCQAYEVGDKGACGKCAGCLAYNAAQAALKAAEVGDGIE